MSPEMHSGARPRFEPERWTRICAVLDRVAATGAEAREPILAAACREYGLEREEVEPFLRATPPAFLEALPAEVLREVFELPVHPQSAARVSPGATLLERYRLLAHLGSGGMGDVYLAEDLALGQRVALKFLSAEIARAPQAMALVANEVLAARTLAHPGVCRVHDLGLVDGVPFLSMELIPGESLDRRLAHGPPLSFDEARAMALQICDAVAFAHEHGLVHCDLKPSNVMVTPDGEVKITDFGLAGLVTALEGSASPYGTPGYLAPERLAGAPPTCASDVYALGLLLLDLFVGRSPSPASGSLPTPAARRLTAGKRMRQARLPRDLIDLIDSCLEESAAARPQSGGQVREELAAVYPWDRHVESRRSVWHSPKGTSVLVAAGLLGLVAVVSWSPRLQLVHLGPATRPPQALAEHARGLLAELGYPAPGDAISGYFLDWDAVASRASRGVPTPPQPGPGDGEGPAFRFFYRESGKPIVGSFDAWSSQARSPWSDTQRGVELAPDGRLLAFHGVAPSKNGAVSAAEAWRRLRTAAAAKGTGDPREANVWPTEFPGKASQHPAGTPGSGLRRRLFAIWDFGGLLIGIATAGFFAYRAWRRGQVDVRATRRVGIAMLLVVPMTWGLLAHHSQTSEHAQNFLQLVAWTIWVACANAVCFAAVTAAAARWWPSAVGGGLRWLRRGRVDSRLGRDLLTGTLAGIALALLDRACVVIPPALGLEPPSAVNVLPFVNAQPEVLGGGRPALGYLLYQASHLWWLLVINMWWFCLLKLALRRTAAAAVAKCALDTYLLAPATGSWIVGTVYTASWVGTGLWIFTHHGLVALLVAGFVRATLFNYPLSFSATSWFAGWSWLALLLVAGLLIAGATIAVRLRGRIVHAIS